MAEPRTIVFVCLHGAAKSVIAAAYMNRLSEERGLQIHATAAGLEPDPTIGGPVTTGLLDDGLDVRHLHPRRVTRDELASAWRVVSLGCDLTPVAPQGTAIDRWDDVPMVNDGFPAARDAILAHVRRLVDKVKD